jgi:thiol-disulfide isomerase/thioredoxin
MYHLSSSQTSLNNYVISYTSVLDQEDKRIDVKGKIKFIEFWGTWCAPCIAGFDHLNEIYNHYKSDSTIFLAITKEKESVVQAFFKKRKKTLNFIKLIDTTGNTEIFFNIVSFPTLYILSAEDSLLWKGRTPDLTFTIIDSILNKTKKYHTQENIQSETLVTAPARYFKLNISKSSFENKGFGISSDDNDIYILDARKQSISELIIKLARINKTRQLKIIDTLKAKQKVDIDFSYQLSCCGHTESLLTPFSGMYIPKSPNTNLLLYSLSKGFRFNIKVKNEIGEVYYLYIKDKEKYSITKPLQSNHSGFAENQNNPNEIEFVNSNLFEIVDVINQNSKFIISNPSGIITKKDLSINLSTIEEITSSFEQIGLGLKKVKAYYPVFYIDFL